MLIFPIQFLLKALKAMGLGEGMETILTDHFMQKQTPISFSVLLLLCFVIIFLGVALKVQFMRL